MLTTNLLSFLSALLIMSASTLRAAPVSVTSQIEILRISGVDEREIEQALNPNHVLASAHESTIPPTRTVFTAPQQYIMSAISKPAEPQFAATIDAYSTARTAGLSAPASASAGNLGSEGFASASSSHGAFQRVKNWMGRRTGSGTDDDIVVTGRLGDIKIRGRR